MAILKSQDGLIQLDRCPHCDYLVMQSDMIEEDAKIMGHKHEWRTRYFYTRDLASGMYCQCGAELDLGDVEDAINVLEDIAYGPCLVNDVNAARARQVLQGAT